MNINTELNKKNFLHELDSNIRSITLVPSKLTGTVNAPSSKSITHRAIICAALSKGESTINNVSFSNDIYATIEAVKSLGASVEIYERKLIITGIDNRKIDYFPEIYCNESASTLRFIIPIAMSFANKATFTAESGLVKRPLDVYFEIFKKQNISYKYVNDDLNVSGIIKSGNFYVDGSISSQFVSGLLFTAPLLQGNSTIHIVGELQSKSYVDLTIDVLKTFGIKIENHDYKMFKILGNQEYIATNYTVEGDFSQTSVFEIANFLGNHVDIQNTNPKSLQGDAVILENIKQFKLNEDITIDGSNCPDIVPIMALGACFRKYNTRFINVERLKIKECDRLQTTFEVLSKLGANIDISSDSMLVYGRDENYSFDGGITIDSYNDHRIAMLIAIASTKCNEPLTLTNPSCINKSYPNFFEVFNFLGGEINE